MCFNVRSSTLILRNLIERIGQMAKMNGKTLFIYSTECLNVPNYFQHSNYSDNPNPLMHLPTKTTPDIFNSLSSKIKFDVFMCTKLNQCAAKYLIWSTNQLTINKLKEIKAIPR